MKYRPEIDGLRAVAVVPVILFHAGYGLFNGGYVGVDVFFVISGYLITSIILKDIAKNRFSILNFYERRARRILPALVFTIILFSLLAWLTYTPSAMKSVFQQLVSNSVFLSNVHYTLSWGYFDSWKLPPIFLNTWSLAVEEQFYFFIPLIMYFLRKKLLVTIITFLILIICSLGWSIFSSKAFPIANYYLLSSRFWELGAGTLLAYFMYYKPLIVDQIREFSGQYHNYIFIFLLVLLFVAYGDNTPYPSVWTVPAIILTCLIILCIVEKDIAGKILAQPFLVYVGKLSYPLYLLHFPAIIFFQELLVPAVSKKTVILLALLSTAALAVFVYHYVEVGFRSRKFFKTGKSMLMFSFITLILVCSFGILGHLGKIHSRSLLMNPELTHLTKQPLLPAGVSLTDCAGRSSEAKCTLIEEKSRQDTRRFVVVGDSFAANIVSPIWLYLKNVPNVTLGARITFSCSFMPSGLSKWNDECGKARTILEKTTLKEVTDVIFHIDFIGYLNERSEEYIKTELDSLTSMFNILIKSGIRVHVVAHRDVFNFEPTRAFVFPWLAKFLHEKDVPMELFEYYNIWRLAGLNVYTQNSDFSKKDIHKFYSDSGHLSQEGSIKFLELTEIFKSKSFLNEGYN
jgi:peptidoglycan/LPS O-acetylase OafA/YrhL